MWQKDTQTSYMLKITRGGNVGGSDPVLLCDTFIIGSPLSSHTNPRKASLKENHFIFRYMPHFTLVQFISSVTNFPKEIFELINLHIM